MLAEYTIKMTLDNGDSFTIGISLGIVLGVGLLWLSDWLDKR
jgi:hypothetical protein